MRSTAKLLAVIVVLMSASAAHAQLIIAVEGHNAPSSAFVYDIGAAQWRAVFRGVSVYGLAADDAGGRLFVAGFTPSGSLGLYQWNYTDFGSNTVPTRITGFQLTGTPLALAWDSARSKLYTTYTQNEGVYEVNPTNGAMTLVLDFLDTDYDFSGLDYNPTDGMLYGVNDDALPHGTGLFRINIDTGVITTVLTPLPPMIGNPTTSPDVDGLAIGRRLTGDTKAYFVLDEPGDVGIFNLTTGQVEPPLTNPLTTAFGNSAGAWSNTLLGSGLQADLAITMIDAPDPVVPPGGPITYTIGVTNNGPDAASNVVVTNVVPANVSFVSTTAPGVHNAGVVTANLGAIAVSGTASFQVVVGTGSFVETVQNSASVTSAVQDAIPANNTAQATTTVRGPQADLRVTMTDPADCIVSAGQVLTYNITVTNLGTESASGVVLTNTLPTGASFQSSTPAAVPSGGVLTIPLGAMASGAEIPVTVSVIPGAGGVYVNSAQASSNAADPDIQNNSASQSTTIAGAVVTAATIRGVLSNVPASASSMTGAPGVRFTSLSRPWKSPSGTRWIMAVDTDTPAASDAMLIIGDGSTFTIGVREGITLLPTLPSGNTPFGAETFDPVQGINDVGQYVFSGIDSRISTADDGYIAKWDGTQFVLVAQEAAESPAPFPASTFYGSQRGSATIRNDGAARVSFFSTLTGPGVDAATNAAFFSDDGNSIFAQKGVTTPFSQATGPYTIKDLDAGATAGGCFVDGDGFNTLATAWLNASPLIPPASGVDRVLLVNSQVVVQENIALPGSGFTSPAQDVAPFHGASLEGDGSWFACGSNNDGLDWVISGFGGAGQVQAVTGGTLFFGAGEHWSQATNPRTFIAAAGNRLGAYIIVGATDFPNPLMNSVMVYSGQRVVARENDPVDLDSNGLFDDAAFIRSFIDHQLFMTDAGEAYAIVTLRANNAANCGGPDTELGRALIRIPLIPPPTCGSADFDGDGDTGTDADIEAFFSCLGGNCCPTCHTADFDGDGDTGTDADIEAFFRVLGGGMC